MVSLADNVLTTSATDDDFEYQWINYYTNEDIAGATSSSLTVTENGSYKVKVNMGNCYVTSDCFDVNHFSNVGVTHVAHNELKMFPNPSTGAIRIQFNSNVENARVDVLNALGQIVFGAEVGGSNEFNFMIDDVAGMYTVKIQSNKGVSTHKLNVVK